MENTALQEVAIDVTSAILALANALVAKGVLSKQEIAEAAQERLLTVLQGHRLEAEPRLELLRELATAFEGTDYESPGQS